MGGGAIRHVAGICTIRRCLFSFNDARGDTFGSAILSADCLELEDSTFQNNTNTTTGGHTVRGIKISATRCRFENNGHGHAILADGADGSITCRECDFVDSSIGLALRANAVTCHGCSFHDNAGGAIFASSVDCHDCEFHQNGGSSTVFADTLRCIDCDFVENSGATTILVSGHLDLIERCRFLGNAGNVQDLSAPPSILGQIRNSLFVGNLGVFGGAVYLETRAPRQLTNLTMAYNTATSRGGAVYIGDANADVTLTNRHLVGQLRHPRSRDRRHKQLQSGIVKFHYRRHPGLCDRSTFPAHPEPRRRRLADRRRQRLRKLEDRRRVSGHRCRSLCGARSGRPRPRRRSEGLRNRGRYRVVRVSYGGSTRLLCVRCGRRPNRPQPRLITHRRHVEFGRSPERDRRRFTNRRGQPDDALLRRHRGRKCYTHRHRR